MDNIQTVAAASGQQGQRGITILARIGYAAMGLMYALVGLLATQAALGVGGATTDTEGALRQIAGQPFGRITLVVIGLGLGGHAIWRVLQAVLDPQRQGAGARGLALRGGYLVSAATYAGLAVSAFDLAGGPALGAASQAGSPQDWTARLMSWPLGPWLIGLAGLVVIAVGGYQLYLAYSTSFQDRFRRAEMSAGELRWSTRAGRLGYAARGVVFAIIGWFLLRAALHTNPAEVRGFGGALAALAAQPYGPWLLGVVAAGLLAYGALLWVLARYGDVKLAAP